MVSYDDLTTAGAVLTFFVVTEHLIAQTTIGFLPDLYIRFVYAFRTFFRTLLIGRRAWLNSQGSFCRFSQNDGRGRARIKRYSEQVFLILFTLVLDLAMEIHGGLVRR